MSGQNPEPPDIEDRTHQLAIRIVRLCQRLDKEPGVGRTLARQLLRSGTSIGANVEEARAGYSKPEVVCKMAIALKEVRETRYGLRILIDAGLVDRALLEPLLSEATEVMKVVGAIPVTARRNLS